MNTTGRATGYNKVLTPNFKNGVPVPQLSKSQSLSNIVAKVSKLKTPPNLGPASSTNVMALKSLLKK